MLTGNLDPLDKKGTLSNPMLQNDSECGNDLLSKLTEVRKV